MCRRRLGQALAFVIHIRIISVLQLRRKCRRSRRWTLDMSLVIVRKVFSVYTPDRIYFGPTNAPPVAETDITM